MMRSTPFQIFYNTFFSILLISVIALLVITPADCIRQCLQNHQIYNVFVIAGSYLLTIVLGGLIYASRIYTTRTVLTAIPKTWIPVEEGDVSKRVRVMIIAALRRSAIIAWDAQPHDEQRLPTSVSAPEAPGPCARPFEADEEETKEKDHLMDGPAKGDQVVVMPPEPLWSTISHDGWAPPTSPDLSNLEYHTVVSELPHLIEARAVSLAPPDPESSMEPPIPDIRAVKILQRPAWMGLRDYLTLLTSFGTVPIASSSQAATFLDAYENARFAGSPLSEAKFRRLMKEFADILRIMQSPSPDILATLDFDTEGDSDDDGASTPTPMSPASRSRSRSVASSSKGAITRKISRTDSSGTIHTAPSRPGDGQPSMDPSRAPVSPARSWKRPPASKTSSYNSFAQSRAPYNDSTGSGASSESLRSLSTQGSVIRISQSIGRNANEEEEEKLPYVLNIPGSR